MSERCSHCKASVVAVRSESRHLALMRFAQLQRQGHLPRMCESANGQFAVCYDDDAGLDGQSTEIEAMYPA